MAADELPGRLHGLAAAAGEEHAVEPGGGEVDDALGQRRRARVGVPPQREEGELLGLAGASVGQLLAPVADLPDEQPGQRVEVAVALGVLDERAVAADDERHVGLTDAGEVEHETVRHLGASLEAQCAEAPGA